MARARGIAAIGTALIAGVIVVAGLLAYALVRAWPSPPVPEPPPPVRIMLVGDSITQGSGGNFTWRYRLWKHLESAHVRTDFVGPRRDLHDQATGRSGLMAYADAGFDLDHDARWGRRLAEAVEVIEGDVRAAAPDYVMVLLGVNDLIAGATVSEVEGRLRRFVTHVRAARPEATIVLGTLLPTVIRRAERLPARIAEYNARIVSVAREMSTAESPVSVASTGRDMVPAEDLYDGLHPNDRGEIKIAAAFADVLAGQFHIGQSFVWPALPAGSP